MTPWPCFDSACRFFPDIAANSHRLALAIGLGLILCYGAQAQSPAKGTPEHIKAVTSAVDGASIKANTATSNDWPTIGLDYAETRFSKLNKIKLGGYVQGRFEWREDALNAGLKADGGLPTSNRFYIKRARVKTTYAGDNTEFVFEVDATIAAGLKVVANGNAIDGTLAGLLADRPAIEARLLRQLEGA